MTDRANVNGQWRERLSLRIVECLAEGAKPIDAIRRVLDVIVEHTAFDVAAIRVQQGEDYPFLAACGLAQEFISSENSLLRRSPDGMLLTEADGRPSLACLCGHVIRGPTESTRCCFTDTGSFVTGSLQEFAASADSSQVGPLRKSCLLAGFRSHVLVPIKYVDEIVGSLHLSGTQPSVFCPEDVQYFECLVAALGGVLAKERARPALRRPGDLRPFARTTSTTRPDDRAVLSDAATGGSANTDQEQHEANIAYSLSLLKATIESSADGLLVVNPHGQVTLFNQRFVELWNIPADLIANRDDDQLQQSILVQLSEPQAFIDKVRGLYLQPEMESFDRLHFRDGRIFERYSRPQLLQGEVIGRVWSFRDVTERARSEEALRESEARFHELADLLPQTVFEADATGKFTYVNKTGLDSFGYSAEELSAGLNLADMIALEDRARALQAFRAVLTNSRPSRGNEYSGIRKDGTTIPILIHSNPQLHDNQVCGIRGILVDMTDAKQAEQERQKLQAQLLQAQKMESIGTLAGGIAHDFNNLLGGILGGLSLMELDLSDGSMAEQEVQEMKELVNRGAELTKQLLGFARRGKYDARALDANQAVARNAKMFGRTRKDIAIRLELTHGVLPVLADDAQLDQVLLNLLLNAGQAMLDGGELILCTQWVQLSAAEAALHGTEPGQYVQIMVKDLGVGMSADTLKRVFEPFFTTKEKGRGTGLGLASVYGIVKNHGGFTTVESELGTGTTFCVHLPAVDEIVEQRRSQPSLLKSGSETLLLVDDEEQILRTTGKLLEAMGYDLLIAKSGQEAVETFRLNRSLISLVILDMVMPGMSGLQTFAALRELSTSIKVLLCSGYSAEGQAVEILQRGCNGFIQKPYDATVLSAKLRELLR
jgi:PAS domain S-box-containing protein